MQQHNLILISALAALAIGCLPDLPEWTVDSGSFGNQRPQIKEVSLDPENPTVQDTVQALVNATDPEGDDITLSFNWLVNGESVGNSEDTLVGAEFFQKGDTITVEVTPYDPIGSGITERTETMVQNSAPTDPIVTLTPIERCESLYINESITMDMPNYSGLVVGSDFTVEMWMLIQDLPPADAEQSALILAHGNADNIGFRLGLDNSSDVPVLELILPDATSEATTMDYPLSDSDWNHIVLTHSYPFWGIYINGQRVLSHEANLAMMPDGAMPLRFGNVGEYRGFDGWFYAIRFSQENLFSAEPETFDYNQARYSMIRPTAQTIGLWLAGPEPEEAEFLDDGATETYQVLLDHSAFSHDIRIQNGMWEEACPGVQIKDLRCEARDSVDHDGDFFTYEFAWSVDDMEFTAHPLSGNIQDAWAEQIQEWTKISCTVQATDSENQSDSITERINQ